MATSPRENEEQCGDGRNSAENFVINPSESDAYTAIATAPTDLFIFSLDFCSGAFSSVAPRLHSTFRNCSKEGLLWIEQNTTFPIPAFQFKMLAAIAGGKERSRFILLRDNVHSQGACLLRYITKEFLQRYDAVFAFILEQPSTNFERYFENENRLLSHAGFQNPLNWNSGSCDQPNFSSTFYLTKTLKSQLMTQLKRRNLLQYSTDQPMRIAVIVDSLSSLTCHQNITTLCQDIWQVMHSTEKDYEIMQVAAIIHSDLHEDSILSGLNYMATTSIEMEGKPVGDTGNHDGYYTIIHCKKSGKVQRERECYKLGADCRLHIEKRKETGPRETGSLDTSVDVTSGLTFNLRLTEDEKEARSKLQLPYVLTEQVKRAQLSLGKKGQIFYEAEDVDDLDEEDPDDDLNI